MRNYDLTPLYRNTIGFDRLFDLLDTAGKVEAGGYPPYNIVRVDEDQYRITLAVAGFGEEDLDIVIHENTLTITGRRPEGDEQDTILHQGIAGRSFERRFQLADYVKIDGATLDKGLLNVQLRRELPEAKRPRKIEINARGENVQILKNKTSAA